MKKLLFSAALLFAAVAGYNCYNRASSNDDEMSDLMKANVEALARGVDSQCYFDPDFRECTVYNHDSHCYCGL